MVAERVFAYDLIRCAGIVLVLLAHTATLFPLTLESMGVLLPLYQIGQLSNGLFFLLSGTLMLPRERQRGFPFLWRRVGQFLGLLVFWSIATNTCAYLADGMYAGAALWRSLLENNVLVGGKVGAAGQLWFLSVIAILYLGLPFIGRMTVGLRGREYWVFAGLTCLFVLVPGTFGGEHGMRSLLDPESEVIYGAYPLFGTYLAWFLLGDFFARWDAAAWLRGHLRFASVWVGGALFLSLVVSSAWEVSLMRGAGRAEMYLPVHLYSDSLFLFVDAVLLYVLLLLLSPRLAFLRRGAERMSRAVFGIYLSHMAVRVFVPSGLAALGCSMGTPVAYGMGAFFCLLAGAFCVAQGLRWCPGLWHLVR